MILSAFLSTEKISAFTPLRRQGEEIMKLMRALNDEGTTIIQVTHDTRVAAFGQRIVELNDGWLAADRRAEASA